MLPVKTIFHTDELAVSYASRLASANGLLSMQDLLRDFQINVPAFLTGMPDALRTFSNFTDCDFQSTCRSSFAEASENYVTLAGQTLERARVLRGSFRVCPGCLREDIGDVLNSRTAMNAFARIVWSLKSARVCPHHELLLVLPPEDGPLHDFWGTWSPWMMDIADGDLDRRIDIVGQFEKHAANVFAGISSSIGWANQFDLGSLGIASEMLGRAVLRLVGRPDNEEQLARATDRGFALTAGGPDQIETALMALRCQSSEAQVRPQGAYAPLYEWLNRGSGTKEPFKPIRRIVREHVWNTWPLSVDETIFDKANSKRRFHSVLTASQTFGMRPSHVAYLLADAGMAGELDLPLFERIYPAAEVCDVLEPISGSVSVNEASRRLGLTRTQMSTLMQTNLFRPGRGGDEARPRFTEAQIQQFLARHECIPIMAPYDVTGLSLVDIASAARVSQVTVAVIYKLVLDGHVPNARRAGSDLRWSSLMVPRHEVDQLVRPATGLERVSISAASKVLAMDTQFIRELAQRGYFKLQDERDERTGLKKTTLGLPEMDEFRDRYITVRGLSRSIRQPVRRCREILEAAKSNRWNDMTQAESAFLRKLMSITC